MSRGERTWSSSFYATVCVALIASSAGCGDDKKSGDQDAGTSDVGSVDDAGVKEDEGAIPDRGADAGAMATVRVVNYGEPIADVTVVFHSEDGEVLGTATTDKDGKASYDIGDGGMATAIMSHVDLGLVTLTGIKPGDDVVIGDGNKPQAEPAEVGKASVKLPGDFAGAAGYKIDIGCNADGEISATEAAVELAILEPCLTTGKKINVFAVAMDEYGPIAYSAAKDVALAAAGQLTNVTLPDWSTTWQEVPFTVTSVPQSAMVLLFPGLTIDGAGMAMPDAMAMAAAGTANASVTLPQGWTGAFGYMAMVPMGEKEMSMRIDNLADVPASLALDYANDFIPSPGKPNVDATDPARPKISWNASTVGDGTMAGIGWAPQGDPPMPTKYWVILMPPGTSSVQLPALPAELAGEAPPEGATIEPEVVVFEASFIDGWDKLRLDFMTQVANMEVEPGSVAMMGAYGSFDM